MKILDTVLIKETKKFARIKQIITTYKFNPTSVETTYKLDDGNEYKKNQIEFDKELSRDNRLKDLL
jgi:hypothetical protein